MVDKWPAIMEEECQSRSLGTNDISTTFQCIENGLERINEAFDRNCKRYSKIEIKLTKSQDRVEELEKALRESVLVAIDRDLEVNAGQLEAREEVFPHSILYN